MTVAAPPSEAQESIFCIENWLLHSDIQISDGVQRGGIAGWLDRDGEPEFVYLEIAGYYLTAMAWLSSGAVRSREHAQTVRRRARFAADWMANLLAKQDVPPTRLYLSQQRTDWRNGAVFSFDLAMAARGLGATMHAGGRREHQQTLAAICALIARISSGADMMVSHEFVHGCATTMPDRWSTRPGPHHLKAAAALLRLPDRVASTALIGVAQRTSEYWAHALWSRPWPCQELHALLYGLEGLLILAGKRDAQGLRVVERPFARLIEGSQAADGTLPETVHGGIVRSDVLAQALRIGLLLRSRGFLTGAEWADRLNRLTDALLGFVRPDGGVLFSHDQSIANTWCALFALQALHLSARQGAREPAPTSAFQLLV